MVAYYSTFAASGDAQPFSLVVGGQEFLTTRGTLLSEQSCLQELVESVKAREVMVMRDRSVQKLGASLLMSSDPGTTKILIDRDGTHFRYILNYLRGSNFHLPLGNPDFLKELLVEANFYELHGLVGKLCDAILGPDHHHLAAEKLIWGDILTGDYVVE